MKKIGSFEFFLAFKYLVPKRRALSRSLLSILSIIIISLVSWLILVFLSVTDGIEKNWIKKLTALNAPIRVVPTDYYYNSYYYKIDDLSSSSDYTKKTLREKFESKIADPYQKDVDIKLPKLWPRKDLNENNKLIDPVKQLFSILSKKDLKLSFDDYESTAALLKLSLIRNNDFHKNNFSSYLSQMTYILSFSEKSPNFSDLFVKPKLDDLNNLLAKISSDEFKNFFNNTKITKVQSKSTFQINASLIKNADLSKIHSYAKIDKNENISNLFLAMKHNDEPLSYTKGKLIKRDEKFIFITSNNKILSVDNDTNIFFAEPIIFDVEIDKKSIAKASNLNDISLWISGKYQNIIIKKQDNLSNFILHEATPMVNFLKKPSMQPLWVYTTSTNGKKVFHIPQNENTFGIILPKTFLKNGVLIGDTGNFIFPAKNVTSVIDQKINVSVAGFYETGFFSIGNRCVLANKDLVNIIYSSNLSPIIDRSLSNGIFVWPRNIQNIEKVKKDIIKHVKKSKIEKYFDVQTYKEFDFAKDLFQQFSSDKLLFTLIALVIIIVACSNIISLLILLVNDKKKEIATLQAMGASKKSIISIFSICGSFVGFIGMFIGSIFAYITLKNLHIIIKFLSFLQGHDAFGQIFENSSYPTSLSKSALLFVFIATPMISTIAGILPAIKACKLNPSQTLRAD